MHGSGGGGGGLREMSRVADVIILHSVHAFMHITMLTSYSPLALHTCLRNVTCMHAYYSSAVCGGWHVKREKGFALHNMQPDIAKASQSAQIKNASSAQWIHIDWVHHRTTNTKPVKTSNGQTTDNLIEIISEYSEEANNASFCQSGFTAPPQRAGLLINDHRSKTNGGRYKLMHYCFEKNIEVPDCLV